MATLTKAQQQAKTNAEAAAFAARRKPVQQTLGQQMSASLQSNAAKLAAMRAKVSGTVSVFEGNALINTLPFAGVNAAAEAVRSTLSDHDNAAADHNRAGGSRYTRHLRLVVEVTLA